MDTKKKNKPLLNAMIIVPCALHNFIFLCFRFAEWRELLPEEVQLRISVGTISIGVAFMLYYTLMIYLISKYYKENDKIKYLLYIFLVLCINIGSFLVGYFKKF
jgi:hypothetical protein